MTVYCAVSGMTEARVETVPSTVTLRFPISSNERIHLFVSGLTLSFFSLYNRCGGVVPCQMCAEF